MLQIIVVLYLVGNVFGNVYINGVSSTTVKTKGRLLITFHETLREKWLITLQYSMKRNSFDLQCFHLAI